MPRCVENIWLETVKKKGLTPDPENLERARAACADLILCRKHIRRLQKKISENNAHNL